MSDILLTPSALLGVLNEIEELKGSDITIRESDDSVVLIIDENEYVLDASDSIEVEVDDEAIKEVETANDDGYEELGEEVEEVDTEEIEGGMKELVKTLALGGLIRLTKNALEKA